MSDWQVVEPPPAAAPSGGDSEWTVVDHQPGEVAPAQDGRSFLARAYDTVAGGARAVGHVARDIAAHPIDTLANPAKRRELERGVDDMVTLGYGQRLAGRIGRALGDSPETDLGATEATDAAAAPEYRQAGQVAGMFTPGASSAAARVAGRAIAPATRLIGRGGEAIGSAAARVPVVGGALRVGAAGATGAAKGIAEYEAAAPATAALSASAEGHREEAAHAAAADPAGLLLGATVGGGMAAGRRAGRAVDETIRAAPDAEATKLIEGVMAGEGKHGRATLKAAKLLERQAPAAVEVLRADKDLRAASAKPAKQALPVFEAKLDAVGSQLDPHYDVVDGATGGVSVQNLVNVLDDEIGKLSKDPLNEQYVHAIQSIRDSALSAWAPDMEPQLQASKRLTDMGLTARKEIPDVMVPTRDVRRMVTRLQKRGTEVINALNPGEASQMKADMADMMKRFIDAHLDVAAEQSPEAAKAVEQIRALNREYSAVATMHKAIEQRAWKETTGSTSAGAHLSGLVRHAGTAGAAFELLHGNVLGAGAALAAPHAIPIARAAGRGAVLGAAELSRSPQYAAAVQRLARVAQHTQDMADFVRQAGAGGLGVSDARRIWEAAHR